MIRAAGVVLLLLLAFVAPPTTAAERLVGLARACNRYNKGRYAGLEKPAAKVLPLTNFCAPRQKPASRR